jgi:hypothetical protein
VGAVRLLDDVSLQVSDEDASFGQTFSEDEALGTRVAQVNPDGGGADGTISGIAVGVPVKLPDGSQRRLDEAYVIQSPTEGAPFSTSGDSGSLVISSNRKAVGFVVAADKTSSFVIPFGSALHSIDASVVSRSRIVRSVADTLPKRNVPAQPTATRAPYARNATMQMSPQAWVLVALFCAFVAAMLGIAVIGLPPVQGLGTVHPSW